LVELGLQLDIERADREQIEAEVCELKQNSPPAATGSAQLTADVVRLFS
jgi:hypothetical protein